MTAHSKIGASSMSRWSVCPASVRLSEGMPNTSSAYAQEGTRAHELAEAILNGKGGVPIEDMEMYEAVGVYVDYIKDLQKGCSTYGIEEKFDLSSLYPGLFGTCDAWVYHSSTATLHIIDYKHGQGIAVEVEGNKQLRYYALGALLKLNLPVSQVEMTIVQPRAFHPDGPIRSWKIPVSDLLDFTADLVEAAERTKDVNEVPVPGDHCRFCPAAPTCSGLHETAIETAKMEFSPSLSYNVEELSSVLGKIDAIKAWASAVEKFAYEEANKGIEIPGYKLVPKRATRKWIEAEKLEDTLLLELGLDYLDLFEPKMKSPAQVEKILDKEGKKLLESYVSKVSTGTTLAPITDKRKPSKSSVEADFTKLT